MKLLLTGAFAYSDSQIEKIKSLGFDVLFHRDERAKIPFDVSDVDAVVCNGLFLYNPIEDFKSLKFIQLTSAGLDRAPLGYIKLHGIKLFNASGVYSAPMAEFALCGVLQIMKQSRFFYNNQRAHKWEKHRGLTELSGKTVLIVGAGSVGKETAKLFGAFGTKVLGVDLKSFDSEYFDEIYPVEEIDSVIPKADIVVLTLPLNADNAHFFNMEKFSLMKNSAVFVNIARGGLVNTEDLISALKREDIASAVLDVFEEEPLPENSPLWDMENVIITPHNSFVGDNNNQKMFGVIYKNLKGLKND